VVARVPRCVQDIELAIPEGDHVSVRDRPKASLRHRLDRAEEVPQGLLAVHARRAGQQLRGVGEVRGAALMYPHGRAREVGSEGAGASCVVEVDVSDHDVREVLRAHSEVPQAGPDGVHARRRSGLHERRLRGVEQVARGHPAAPAHHRVDRRDTRRGLEGLRHGGQSIDAGVRVGGAC
jgi:hypothetical protein